MYKIPLNFGRFNSFTWLSNKSFRSMGFDTWNDGLSAVLGNFFKKLSGSGLTDAEKEQISAEEDSTRRLAEDDWARKIQFYNDYESIPAQVRQANEAGVNPMILFGGGGAGATASGGVGASSGGSVSPDSTGIGMLSSLLQFALQSKSLELDAQRVQNDTKLADAAAAESESRTLR